MRARSNTELVTVLATGDKASLALAQSLLEGAGIKYTLRGDLLQDLFLWGRLGFGFNPLMGPTQIMVNSEDAETARELIHHISPEPTHALPLVFRLFAALILITTLVGLIVVIIDQYIQWL